MILKMNVLNWLEMQLKRSYKLKILFVAEEIINTDSDLFKEKAAVFVSIYNNE
ncbi:hypothetical protein [Lachnobacterium bovis]|uniref:hypothetical protein n=1 Tax=Lachnobacterium bovis TaxID=140626 RepID=UPI0018659450|nr:hypothetical protein [Lachnobacterium bovis]